MYTRNAVSAMSVEQVNKLENDAVTMGMSAPEVGEIVSKYGPDVLSVMVEALKGGFSVGFVLELFRLFGPIFLDFAISLFTEKKKMVHGRRRRRKSSQRPFKRQSCTRTCQKNLSKLYLPSFSHM